MREGSLVDMPGCKTLDSVALEMIRVLYVGTGLLRIWMDHVGFQCRIWGVAVHGADEGGFGITQILTERVDKPLTFLLHT